MESKAPMCENLVTSTASSLRSCHKGGYTFQIQVEGGGAGRGEKCAASPVSQQRALIIKGRRTMYSSPHPHSVPFLSFLVITEKPTTLLFIRYLSYKWLPHAAVGQEEQLIIPGRLQFDATQTYVKVYHTASTEKTVVTRGQRVLPMA